MHVYNHSGENDDVDERRISHLKKHFLWDDHFVQLTVKQALSGGLLSESHQVLTLTDKGIQFISAANSLFSSKYHPGFEALRKEFVIFTD